MPRSHFKEIIKKTKPKIHSNEPKEISLALQERLDQLEVLQERLGQSEALVEATTDYLIESKKELLHLGRYRLAAITVTALIILFLFSLLICVIFYHQMWFFLQGQYTRSAIILGTLTGAIILTTVALKGVFRSAADRSKEDSLPPHLKEALEIAKLMR